MRSREPKRQLVEPVATRRQDRKAILDAAESLLLDQGFDRVSLAAVVGQSGGSLATLYELFGNKQGLLRAVIERVEKERPATLDGMIPQMEIGRASCRARVCQYV